MNKKSQTFFCTLSSWSGGNHCFQESELQNVLSNRQLSFFIDFPLQAELGSKEKSEKSGVQ